MTRSSGWPACVTAGPFMFFSGLTGRGQDGAPITRYGDAPDGSARANTKFDWVAGMEAPVGAQGLALYDHYRAILRKEGSDLAHLLRYHIYQRDKHFFSVFDRIRRSFESQPPASTAVGMGRFEPQDRATVCIDAIALRASAEKELGARTVMPGAAGQVAAATFSHVVRAGHFLFLAGQIPIDTSKPGAPLIRNYDDIPEEGRFLRVGRSHEDTRNGPIASQTWFTYDVIRRHLEAAGSSLDHILNLIVYLQDMRDFPTFHRVHEHFFRAKPPALTVIEVGEVGHKGTLIEIEPTAVLPTPRALPVVFQPDGWTAPAHMSACVSADGLAFFSGISGAAEGLTNQERPRSGGASSSVEEVRDVYTAQARTAVRELVRRFDAARQSIANLAHLTVYLKDITQFAAVERVLADALGTSRPALTLLEVPAVSPARGACVSLTAIGWFGDGKIEPLS